MFLSKVAKSCTLRQANGTWPQTPAEVDKWSISFRTRNEKDNINGR